MQTGAVSPPCRALAALVVALVQIAPANAGDDTVALRMTARATKHPEAIRTTPTVRLDYGSFAWWLVRPEDAARLTDAGVNVEVIDDPYALTLGGARFDPLVTRPVHPPEWTGAAGAGPDLHLVQAVGPVRGSWLDDLRAAELQPLQYIHPFTFVVWGSREAVDEAADLPWVRWRGEFEPAYRVLPPWRHPVGETVAVAIVIANPGDVSTVIHALEGIGVTVLTHVALDHRWTAISALLPAPRLAAAAAVPGVYTIQPWPTDGGARGEMSNQVSAGNVDGGGIAYPGYPTWLGTLGIDGGGVVMANVDQGIDEGHADLAGRVLPCSGTTCGDNASSNHGTHTAAIQAATGNSGVTSLGFLRALGMAPGAHLIEQLYSPFYGQPAGMLLLIAESYANNAVLSSNSWGPSGTPRGYDNDTMQTDMGVRDADAAAGNQAFTYVLSIMNGYGGTSSQGTPDEAKNLITVGSTKMQASDGSQIPDTDDLSSNTAHGPALDGRHIPHLVAPGCRVDSAVPAGYGLSCGTSMSSPHVSGAAALLIEQWRLTHPVDPSPAMIKAELLVSARDLAGNLDADGGTLGHPFDSKQGWGRLDAGALLAPVADKAVFDSPELLIATGDEWIYTVAVDDPTEPVRVMLVWTDAPGHGLGGSTPAWNNDLDLIVEANGLSYPGNTFDGDGWSVPDGSADGMNNTEGVFLAPGTSDEITIRVRATNLGSDGVPGNAIDTDQDFAVAVANAIQAPCTPGTFFHGDLDVADTVIDGAQAFSLDWLPATPRCGGSVDYLLHDARDGTPGIPLISTANTGYTVVGSAPGGIHCFSVGSSEDGVPGQGSAVACASGSGSRTAGDLDCDGTVTATDLVAAVATLYGAPEPTCVGFPAGDANLDGVIDAGDLAQIVRAVHDPL